MKVSINQDGCIECGAYEQTCSEVFFIESGENASIVEKYRKNALGVGEVPGNLASCVNDAAASCPVQVISTG